MGTTSIITGSIEANRILTGEQEEIFRKALEASGNEFTFIVDFNDYQSQLSISTDNGVDSGGYVPLGKNYKEYFNAGGYGVESRFFIQKI